MKKIKIISYLGFAVIAGLVLHACSENTHNETVSTSTDEGKESDEAIAQSYAKLGDVDSVLYNKGKSIYHQKCTHCHEWEVKKKGPALSGVTKRHSAEWITNLLMNLKTFVREDSIITHETKKIDSLKTNNGQYPVAVPLTNEDERRALIEFLRKEG